MLRRTKTRATGPGTTTNPPRSRSPSPPPPKRHPVLGRPDRGVLPGFESMEGMIKAGFYPAGGGAAMKHERETDLANRRRLWGTHVTPGGTNPILLAKLGACKCLQEGCDHTRAWLGQHSTHSRKEGEAQKMCGAWGDSSIFGNTEGWTGTPGEADRLCSICRKVMSTEGNAFGGGGGGRGRKQRKSKKRRSRKRRSKKRTKKRTKKRSKK